MVTALLDCKFGVTNYYSTVITNLLHPVDFEFRDRVESRERPKITFIILRQTTQQ